MLSKYIPQKRSRHGHATSIYLPNMTLHMKLPKTTIQAHPPLGSLDSFVFDFGISSSIFRLLSVFEVWDEGIFDGKLQVLVPVFTMP